MDVEGLENIAYQPCFTCDDRGVIEADCSCYELIGGHQPGCMFHGLTRKEASELANKEFPCPDCIPVPIASDE